MKCVIRGMQINSINRITNNFNYQGNEFNKYFVKVFETNTKNNNYILVH